MFSQENYQNIKILQDKSQVIEDENQQLLKSNSLQQSQFSNISVSDLNHSKIQYSKQQANINQNQQDFSIISGIEKLTGILDSSFCSSDQFEILNESNLFLKDLDKQLELELSLQRNLRIQQLQKVLQNKVKPFKYIGQTIHRKVYLSINKLRQFNKWMKINLQNQQKYDNLTQLQSQVLKDLRKGKVDQIRDIDIDTILEQSKFKKQKNQQNLTIENNILKHLNNFDRQTQLLITSIQDVLIKKNDNLTKLIENPVINQLAMPHELKDSIILRTNQNYLKLIKFFDKRITKADLLYRASRDSFKVAKFHQKCDDIPDTLTIVETELNKIFGGYTPLTWASPLKYQYVGDKQLKSFIFQLNRNDKLTLRKDKDRKAIDRDSAFGPAFGGGHQGHDFIIHNDANIEKTSHSKVGRNYKNRKYQWGHANSYDQFSGGQYFIVKDYEVWKLTFQ